jgi:LemA protein
MSEHLATMSPTVLWTGIIVLAIVLVASVAAAIYNRLVTLRQRYLNAYAQIDVQLKRRYDLIPRLVETVKGYMAHERETLEAVMAARNAAADANQRAALNPRDGAAIASAAGAENALIGVLNRFMLLREAYPDLKADRNALQLMEELSSTENRVAFARQAYNDAVMLYNATRQQIPHVLLAGVLGFTPAELFRIDEAQERELVQVSLTPGGTGESR